MSDSSGRFPDGSELIARDPFLYSHRKVLRNRCAHIEGMRQWLSYPDGLTGPISLGHKYFGLIRGERDGMPGVWYREWAPGADYVALIGDFNEWDRGANPCERGEHGSWSSFFPDEQYAHRLTHGSRVKVHVANDKGYAMDRIPAYIRRVFQVPGTAEYIGQYWNPPPFEWKHPNPTLPFVGRGEPNGEGLRIYEAHVGMASEEGKVARFDEFRRDILPRIADLGYNAVQLMAVQEHPYYGSFGYHVSNLFAVSSRFGTPEDLKRLIDDAHGLGIRVIMDLVHSHMVKNTSEGLNLFDGTDHQYFHSGDRGQHIAWDSMCYDYDRFEVERILLSNCRYWLEEYMFDGFRFDGVTSMLYLEHGLNRSFQSYDDYYGDDVDWDSVAYLTLANDLIHEVKPGAITIAEEMSGMPGLARPTREGGLGFDYRLAMGIPDFWIKLLKEQRDEDWGLEHLYFALLNRRHDEMHIGYAESHDQALVGDKTIAFRLMDAKMYDGMTRLQQDVVVDRGIALHKMIRLLTFSLAGEGYLNFMGNEFGHPEWIDFPREGNQESFLYARRQWSLVDADHLRYQGLNEFDKAMQQLDIAFHVLTDPLIEKLSCHEWARQLVYRRGPLVFAFNFHPNESYQDLQLPVPDKTDYRLVLDTDATEFDGHSRVDPEVTYVWTPAPLGDREQSVRVYLPARSALVLAPVDL